MQKNNLWEVIGIDDLDNMTFAQCSNKEKAIKARNILEENGFKGSVDVRKSCLELDVLMINGERIEL